MNTKENLEEIQLEDRKETLEGFVPLGFPRTMTLSVNSIPEMRKYYRGVRADPKECDVRDLFEAQWKQEARNAVQRIAPKEAEAYVFGPNRIAKMKLRFSGPELEWVVLTPIQFYKRKK